ncbi:polyketide synthase [Gymnopilus junonius]|uniref:Polyketide synthase n=1 Tax=Gymnopilus junonius TaxID=109634 RepID=A0A9P5TKD4_GYMJU|nr:polyketide synthase [Gymnopilus junonius]
MASLFSDQLFIPLFGGQGSSALDPGAYAQNLHSFTSSPSARLLVSSCYAAFCAELDSLDPAICHKISICAADFTNDDSILWPKDEKQINNAAFSWPCLLLNQLLQYLSFVEYLSPSASSTTSFADVLKCNMDHEVGVLGFSSGLLSACVVATSSSTLSFINNAVETYRLALWIGIRSQIFRSKLDKHDEDHRPWAVVLIGIGNAGLLQAIDQFNQVHGPDLINLTAAMGDGLFTVSGHPDDLSSFLETMPEGVIFHQTKITALYHCPSKLQQVRHEVGSDIIARRIHFPSFLDMLAPIRSTFTGNVLQMTDSSGSLLEQVIDMLLIHPVNWDLVVKQTVTKLRPETQVNLLDIGLGTGLVKVMEKAITPCNIRRLKVSDLSMARLTPTGGPKQEPIAIVGMAINMPGSVDREKFWEVLVDGINTVTEIPEERFLLENYANTGSPGRFMNTHMGNFVQNFDQFDHKFFNISPREAKNMDPQQRMLLQTAYHALEDAGYVPYSTPTFNPETFGCFIGASTHDYVQNLRNHIDVYYSTGTLSAFLSGRLSYCLGLSGPSLVLDTACSSSMVAIHQACRSLMNRDCQTALAGGVNVITSPDMFIGLDRGHFLSPSGQCKSFDASADGYARGEGCGIFVLKRLSDALAENDQIMGIIRGIEVNQSGKASSITHPHSSTQKALFKQLLMQSDIDPNSVSVVEAHGTGTQVGDINEMESIRSVLAADRKPNNPLYVTSIKANIGHLEAASGSASLAKVLMMFKHQIIPQQISFQALNPRIAPLTLDNTIISTRNVAWVLPLESDKRVALINNFGAAGSNAALLVEEFIAQDTSAAAITAATTSYVFGLSAKDESSLEELRSQYRAWLQSPISQNLSLLHIAYTATARRQLYPYRLAVSCGNLQQLISRLDTTPVVNAKGDQNDVVFVFSGQGYQYHGMAASLYATSSTFKKYINECDSILVAHGFFGIRSIISGSADGAAPFKEEVLQSATFSLQCALAEVWISWGVQPSAVVGHSLGEYAALVIAGVLSLKDGLLVVATRARLMFQRCPPMTTGMVAVSAEPAKLEAILASNQRFSNVSISCFNSPRHCTLSGPLRDLDELTTHLEEDFNLRVTRIQVPYGYHSPAMLSIVDELVGLGEKTRTHPNRIPFISTVLGRVIMPGDQSFVSHDYFARQCIEPVKFTEAIESYLSNPASSGSTTWLEISSHPSTLPMLGSFTVLSNPVILSSLRMHEDSWISLSKTLTSFYLGCYSIDWRCVFSDIGPAKCASLPVYPFSTQAFLVPFIEYIPQSLSSSTGTKYPCLGSYPQAQNCHKMATFRTPISQLRHYIKGHLVGDAPLCPASIYLDLTIDAVRHGVEHPTQEDGFEIVLHRVNFSKPLTWNSEGQGRNVDLITMINVSKQNFEVISEVSPSECKTTYANGSFQLFSLSGLQKDFVSLLPSLTRRMEVILDRENRKSLETFSNRTIYQLIFPRVVEYSTEFRTLQSLSLSSDGLEAIGVMALPHSCDTGKFSVRPLFLDTLVHIAGFISNLRGGKDYAYICSEINTVQVLSTAITNGASFTLYCRISPFDNESRLLGETFALSDAGPRTLIAHIHGIVFQRVRLKGLQAGLANITELCSPSPKYRTMPKEGSVRSDIDATVSRIVANACGIEPPDLSPLQDFDSFGIDSLMRIELSYDISRAFPGFGCQPEELRQCKNVLDVVKAITSAMDYASDPASPLSSWSTPRTLVHSTHQSPTRRIVAHVLGIEEDTLGDDTELSALGLDSLSSIETIRAFRKEYRLNVPGDLFTSVQTIKDIESQISSLQPSVLPFQDQGNLNQSLGRPVINTNQTFQGTHHKALSLLQNSHSDVSPLVLIHDGSGITVSYERICTLNRRVWAISNPRLGSSEPWDSLAQMAQAYAKLISDEMKGPIIVGGWSFGGVVAFEVARQLQATSTTVKGIILIDSPSPLLRVPMPPAFVDHVLNDIENAGKEFRLLCRNQFTTNAQLMSHYIPEEAQNNETLSVIFLSCKEPYQPPGCNEVPDWFLDRRNTMSVIRGWDAIIGRFVKIFEVPGHHFAPFAPENITTTSKYISEACDMFDR